MPKICYVPKRFQVKTRKLIDLAETITQEYAAAGYDLVSRVAGPLPAKTCGMLHRS